MKTETLPDGSLKITIDADERAQLQLAKDEDPDSFGNDETMYAFFEHLIANSDLDWVKPEWVGALTAAPMLGTFGEDMPFEGSDAQLRMVNYVGAWPDHNGVIQKWYRPVEQVWAFMEYQIASLLESLLVNGQVILTKGETTPSLTAIAMPAAIALAERQLIRPSDVTDAAWEIGQALKPYLQPGQTA